jgi:predicted phage terminase large subunit-like protein
MILGQNDVGRARFKACSTSITFPIHIASSKCRAWDLAASKGTGAYTSGVLIGTDGKGIYYVCDVERGQLSADDAKATLRSTAIGDGQGVVIHLPQDLGQAGKAQAEQLVRFLAGFNVKAEPGTGSKETKAFSFAAQVNSGNVKMVKGSWNKAFKEELRQFPRGKYNDQVDSASDAFNELALGGQSYSGTFRR